MKRHSQVSEYYPFCIVYVMTDLEAIECHDRACQDDEQARRAADWNYDRFYGPIEPFATELDP